MDLQRKIQQLRNDGNDELADAIENMIPRATVAASLRELRAELVADANAMATHGSGTSACTIQDAFDATIAKLGLTAEAFDAAIASRPDALEKLAGEALERGNEMTDEQRLQIRAELARAMGYSVIKDGSYFYLLDRHGSREENAELNALAAELRGWIFRESGILTDESGEEVRVRESECVVFKLGTASDSYPYFWQPVKNRNQSGALLQWFVESHCKASYLTLKALLLSQVRVEWVLEPSMEFRRVDVPGNDARAETIAFCAAMLAMEGRLANG